MGLHQAVTALLREARFAGVAVLPDQVPAAQRGVVSAVLGVCPPVGAAGTAGSDRRAPTTGTWRVERRADRATFLVDYPVVAYWSERDGPAPATGVVEATGVLSAALHGGATTDDLPTVAGRVRRL